MSEGCPCTVNEVDFFDAGLKQVVLDNGTWVDVHPLNNVSSDGPIEFQVNGSSDECIDVNQTLLKFQVKIVNAAGDADLAATDLVGPINNWMHSMFSDVILTINGTTVEGGNHHYPYKAYFSNLLLHGKAAKETQMQAVGWFKDTAQHMNDDHTTNKGFNKRKTLCAQSKVVELAGPLLLDFMMQNKYLIPNTDFTLKFNRSKPEFQCMIKTADTQAGRATAVKVKIVNAILYVRRVKALPSFLLEQEDKLNFENAKYPLQRTEMTTYTIPSGSMSHTKEHVYKGLMPKAIFVAFVQNNAYNGSYSENPFHFQNFDIDHLALYREGESVPFRPFTPDFDNNLYIREYMSLMQSLDIFNKNEDIDLTMNDFANGYAVFGFNLTPDLSIAGHAQTGRDGNCRFEVRFKNAITVTLNVIVMGIFDGRIEITKQRHVLADWK